MSIYDVDINRLGAVVSKGPVLVGPDAEVTPYVNGEESSAIPGGDIAHEYGCVFDVPTGTDRTGATQAAAWVFAPPVTATRAQELVKAAQIDGASFFQIFRRERL